MADLKSIALQIMRKKRMDVNTESIDNMIADLEKCQKGRKVQVLLFLEKDTRLTSRELSDKMKINHRNNLSFHTNYLTEYLLIDRYDESKFKSMDEPIDLRIVYHSITDLGRELITDFGRRDRI